MSLKNHYTIGYDTLDIIFVVCNSIKSNMALLFFFNLIFILCCSCSHLVCQTSIGLHQTEAVTWLPGRRSQKNEPNTAQFSQMYWHVTLEFTWVDGKPSCYTTTKKWDQKYQLFIYRRSPNVILCGWLGSKHQLTIYCPSPNVILCGWLGSKHQLTIYCPSLTGVWQRNTRCWRITQK